MKQTSVLHIVYSLQRGGKERQLALICKHSRGVDNRIICLKQDQGGYPEEYELTDKITYLNEDGFWARLKGLAALAGEMRPQVLISWGNAEAVMSMLLAARSGLKTINFSLRHGIRRKTLWQLSRTLVLHASRYVVANSEAGLRANNLRKGMVLYNGAETFPVSCGSVDKDARKKALTGQNSSPVLVSVANLVPYKDYPTVLKCLSNLKKKSYAFTYLIIGDGPRRAEIEEMIQTLGLSDNVMITGRIANVGDYLDISDIMVHSSLGEGCSNAILEGMSHGLPIVATKVGGTPEIVGSRNSLLFEYGDQVTLERHLISLLDDPARLKSMAEASLQMVRAKFSLAKMVERYEAIVAAVQNNDKKELAELTVRL